jgi:hypothetical protein
MVTALRVILLPWSCPRFYRCFGVLSQVKEVDTHPAKSPNGTPSFTSLRWERDELSQGHLFQIEVHFGSQFGKRRLELFHRGLWHELHGIINVQCLPRATQKAERAAAQQVKVTLTGVTFTQPLKERLQNG